jgi:hypothetical protein
MGRNTAAALGRNNEHIGQVGEGNPIGYDASEAHLPVGKVGSEAD